MMTQKEITAINVDDYVRERKRNSFRDGEYHRVKIYWGKRAFPFWRQFVLASWPTEYGYRLPTIKEMHGLNYMGVKNYIRK